MERRRSLADLLAVAAGELLADMLDHFPLPRDDLQRLGDILAQLAQPRAAAAKANGRSRLDHPLARQMLGEGLARRTLAGKGHDIGGLGHGPLGGDLDNFNGETVALWKDDWVVPKYKRFMQEFQAHFGSMQAIIDEVSI